ncbi:MAG: hypothetical protein AAGJ46_12770 [Planctomycetota bacterium]
MLNWLFGNSQQMNCPMCSARISAKSERCACGAEIPVLYRENYREAHPMSVPLIGWTNTGKSVYVRGLTHTLETMTHRQTLWNQLLLRPANGDTNKQLEEIRRAIRERRLPMPTEEKTKGGKEDGRDFEEVYLMILQGMPLWGDRTLVIRDVAGEHFKELTFSDSQAGFCKRSLCALMTIDIRDLFENKNKAYSMPVLLESYVQTLMKQGCKVKDENRKISVIITKADHLGEMLPARLQAYLESDPCRLALDRNEVSQDLSTSKGMEAYMEVLGRANAAIQEWVRTIPGGNQFIALAQRENITLRFSLVSSTGTPPDGDIMTSAMSPMRAIDPFLWLLEFHSRIG